MELFQIKLRTEQNTTGADPCRKSCTDILEQAASGTAASLSKAEQKA